MKSPHRARTAALVAFLAGAALAPAHAAELGCPGMNVDGNAALRSRWPALLPRVQAEFHARSDIDACARVTLDHEDDSLILISVMLPDGRATTRRVPREDDVIPTLQALLLVPERPRATSAPKSSPPKLPTPAPRRTTPMSTEPRIDRDDPAPAPGARELGIELAVITGARVGDGQFGFGAGVLSLIEVRGWLVGFEGRADGYRPIAGGDPETALELAVLAGKRFDLGRVALDLTAGPAVAMSGIVMSQTVVTRVEESMPVSQPPPPREPSPGPVPRLLLGARVGFSPRSVFRTFLGVDGEIGPTHTPAHEGDFESGRLPRFAVGLALGATVGTP